MTAEGPQKVRLEVVTPERLLLSEEVDMVSAPGALGEFGVLPLHTPLLTTLDIGEVVYRKGEKTHKLALSWGYAEVGPEKVTILAEVAEKAEEIDSKRAEAAEERALKRLFEQQGPVDIERARVALERARMRLRVARKDSK
jgi:F-type H+-transporting ATPase subunit epsilon